MNDAGPAPREVMRARRPRRPSSIRMPSRWLKMLDLPLFLMACGLIAGVSLTPPPVGCALGRACGLLLYHLNTRRRRQAHDNLRMVFGRSMPASRQRRLVKQVFMHLGQTFFETVYARWLLQPRSFRRYVCVHNVGALRAAAREGRGIVCVTGHVGNWEICGLTTGLLGFPLHSLYRPVGGRFLDLLTRWLRERHGQRLVPAQEGVARLIAVLRAGGYVGLVADQYARGSDLCVQFFGLPSATSAIVGLLAFRTGAPVVCGYAIRRGSSFAYDFYILPPLPRGTTGNLRQDLVDLTQAYMNSVETFARRFPGQYIWTHRRWRGADLEHAARLNLP